MSGLWAQLALVGFLILLNAAFAGSEMALISLREAQLQRIEEKGDRGRVLADLARDPNRFLATIQVGITLAGFLASAAAAVSLAEPLIEPLEGVFGRLAEPAAIVAVTLVLTYFTLVLGELAPKRIALQRAEGWAMLAARPVAALASFSRPVVWVLGKSTDLTVRLFGVDPSAHRGTVSEEELRDMIATQTGVSPEQRLIMAGAFEAAERTLREIVVPRHEVVSLPGADTAAQGLRLLAAGGHTRAPVVGDTFDDVLGIVHVIDLVDAEGDVRDRMRPATILPETVGVLDALRRLQADRQQMAVVVNEHGGTEGIITLEDLLEEIVGELYDEFDPDSRNIEREEGGVLTLPGSYPVHDLPDVGAELPEGPYATIAGYTLSHLGHIPTGGEVVEADGWRVEVLAVEGRAITKVRLTPLPPASPGEGREPSS